MRKILTLLFVVSLAFTSCDGDDSLIVAPPCDNVSYTIINNLGIDVDGLRIENYTTTPLADGDTSIGYCIEEVYGLLPNEPWINFELEINGQIVCSTAMLQWCGTGATTEDSGIYEITLTSIFTGAAFPTLCSEYATYTAIKL